LERTVLAETYEERDCDKRTDGQAEQDQVCKIVAEVCTLHY